MKASFITALLLLLTLSLPLQAMTLSDAMSALGTAKASGLVGEKPDGYLGVVTSTPQAQEITTLINQARRAEYQRIAQQNGTRLQDVEVIAGQKAIDKTTAGHYIQRNGAWVKK
ncbi:hypothetical protein LX59_02752 [Azomonas agilis]|uniref:DUF1318 domain-containing protein n=1 Tax=Azomonas agilis TaxID=116849 RepID=A0A562I078_9GAMM|nr:YdbL family protein [Azomonas agilis]TWH64078.1 hypothetical protein LX59_02752 [Azomonas agilis]